MKIYSGFIILAGLLYTASSQGVIDDENQEFHRKLKNEIKQNIYKNIGHLIKKQSDHSEILETADEIKEAANGLADQIKQKVYKNLEPVFGLRSAFRMKSGVGGITTITYGDGTTLLLENNILYKCDGSISSSDGKCSDEKKLFIPEERSSFCYLRSYMETNEGVCLSDRPLLMRCQSKGKYLALTKQEYSELCGYISKNIKYRYYSDPNNPKNVQIPSSNPHVRCSNNEKGICEFTDSLLPETNSNIVLNNYQ